MAIIIQTKGEKRKQRSTQTFEEETKRRSQTYVPKTDVDEDAAAAAVDRRKTNDDENKQNRGRRTKTKKT